MSFISISYICFIILLFCCLFVVYLLFICCLFVVVVFFFFVLFIANDDFNFTDLYWTHAVEKQPVTMQTGPFFLSFLFVYFTKPRIYLKKEKKKGLDWAVLKQKQNKKNYYKYPSWKCLSFYIVCITFKMNHLFLTTLLIYFFYMFFYYIVVHQKINAVNILSFFQW